MNTFAAIILNITPKEMITDKKDMVADWIKENGNPAIEKLTSKNAETASMIASVLDHAGLSADHLAQMIDIHVAEVNKWLSGKHNFSEKMLDNIVEKIESNPITN
ncbi:MULTISPECIES: helix-turn-helix transcriptional regulator [Pedobacter]|uniref:helix-turn-helix domain-containing protein n=1 Tax=Pedobacter TaxID=84567 RepID=UPI0011F4E3E2|nr:MULTISPECIES: helix-turn-helix transcriptional regulator [Pedobacter]RZL68874.1 MAG: XRE family transcriptional regulator [Pedobacter sp.]